MSGLSELLKPQQSTFQRPRRVAARCGAAVAPTMHGRRSPRDEPGLVGELIERSDLYLSMSAARLATPPEWCHVSNAFKTRAQRVRAAPRAHPPLQRHCASGGGGCGGTSC